MDENVGSSVEIAQIMLAEETAEMYFPTDAKLFCQRLQFRLEWTFARNDKFSFGKLPREDCKSTNG